MWAADRQAPRRLQVPGARQRGTAAVEFALLVGLFLTLVFGVLEIARLIYLFNTLQEVTRRAAAMAVNAPFDAQSQAAIRENALFSDASGNLILGSPVTPAHLRIEYLSLARDGSGVLSTPRVQALPANPAANRVNCLVNPNGDNCIRFVRVQVCAPGAQDDCDPVPYQMLFPLLDFSGLRLPRAQTTAPAQTLGFTPGDQP